MTGSSNTNDGETETTHQTDGNSNLLQANDDNNNNNNCSNSKEQRRLRIVSLLPSITEILSFIGVGEDIVGITHECDHPEWVVNNWTTVVVTTSAINPHTLTQSEIHAAVVGSLAQGNSLYGLNHDALRAVQPDIIFTQSLCDVCAVSYPVVLDTCARILAGPMTTCSITTGRSIEDSPPGDDAVSDPCDGSAETNNNNNSNYYKEPQVISMEPNNLVDVLKTFHVAARALGDPSTLERTNIVVRHLELGFETIRQAVAKKVLQNNKNNKNSSSSSSNSSNLYKKPTVAFMEWHCPIFSGGHWIPDMIDIAGGDYRMCQSGDRSAAWTDADFARLDPDVILIGPCGFSLERAVQDTLALYHDNDNGDGHERGLWWKQLRAVQTGRVYALDGNSYYARPGPRLLQGCGIMAKCIHDDDGDDGEDAVLDLPQELAPSSGYCRITPDMYEKKDE